MKKTKKTKKFELDDKEQSTRFVEAARALGIDEADQAFNKALKAIVPRATIKSKKKANPAASES